MSDLKKNEKKIKIAGIDYSITSPAIVVYDGPEKPFNHRYCKAFYFDNRKNAPIRPVCELDLKPNYYPLWNTPEQRYQELASWACSILLAEGIEEVYLEDYIFNMSKSNPGLIFNMAENTGVLKNNLWFMGIKHMPVSPTELKLWVANHGQAKKDELEKRFINETGLEDFRKILWLTEKASAPISDIIDAYYLCKWAVFDKTCGVDVPEPRSKRKKGATKKAKKVGLNPLKPLTKMKKEKITDEST